MAFSKTRPLAQSLSDPVHRQSPPIDRLPPWAPRRWRNHSLFSATGRNECGLQPFTRWNCRTTGQNCSDVSRLWVRDSRNFSCWSG